MRQAAGSWARATPWSRPPAAWSKAQAAVQVESMGASCCLKRGSRTLQRSVCVFGFFLDVGDHIHIPAHVAELGRGPARERVRDGSTGSEAPQSPLQLGGTGGTLCLTVVSLVSRRPLTSTCLLIFPVMSLGGGCLVDPPACGPTSTPGALPKLQGFQFQF